MSGIVGTVWQINDSKRRFVVVGADSRYALVENLVGPLRRRRILLLSLRTSKAKTGYTLIREAPAALREGAPPHLNGAI